MKRFSCDAYYFICSGRVFYIEKYGITRVRRPTIGREVRHASGVQQAFIMDQAFIRRFVRHSIHQALYVRAIYGLGKELHGHVA